MSVVICSFCNNLLTLSFLAAAVSTERHNIPDVVLVALHGLWHSRVGA